jgi:hypothetical protein
MGFSTLQYRKDQKQRRWKINPVWRGIGCFLILLIPIMAWFAASILVQSDFQLINSAQLDKPVRIKYVHVVEIDKVISEINKFSAANNLVSGQFFYTVILMVLGFGLFSVIYGIMYKIVGPPRYGPFDVPPQSMRR